MTIFFGILIYIPVLSTNIQSNIATIKTMYTVQGGDVILRENYGSSERTRLYVRPPAQANIVIVDNKNLKNVKDWLTRIFLPQGYPDSVSKDYMAYQQWDTAQAFCSTITGILATQEVLRGVGVGDKAATPLAATITWVIKDGCGHIGRIAFAFSHGIYLDAYSKKWRLYADTLNDAAMCIEMSLPLFRHYTTFALCVSTIMKAIVGVAGGATRTAMTQHHAVRGNLGDVAAKDSAQETAVNLIASFTALFIITIFGNSLIIFVIMIILHIVFNYLAVRAVCLRTLNEPRFLQVIDAYLRRELILTPCEINRSEPIMFYNMGSNLLDLKMSGFKIKLGCSIKKLVAKDSNYGDWTKIVQLYESRSYILYPDVSGRKMYVLVKEGASTDDILCAYFHAILSSIIVCAINDYNLPAFTDHHDPRPFAKVCHALQNATWTRESNATGFAYRPSLELMQYIDEVACKEWSRVKTGLKHTGWDLTKHLLIVDEWRVSKPDVIYAPSATPNEPMLLEGSKAFAAMPIQSKTDLKKSAVSLEEAVADDVFVISPEASLVKEPANTVNTVEKNPSEEHLKKD